MRTEFWILAAGPRRCGPVWPPEMPNTYSMPASCQHARDQRRRPALPRSASARSSSRFLHRAGFTWRPAPARSLFQHGVLVKPPSRPEFRPRRDRRHAARHGARTSPPTRSRRAPRRSIATTNSRRICGASSAISACSASPSRRNTAAPAWAISSTSSRWRRSAAPRPRSASPTARTPTCASTRSTATAATSRSAATCRS